MNSKMRIALGLVLVFIVMSVTYLATPALTYANGNGELIEQSFETENCDGEMNQIRRRDRLQIQNRNKVCTGEEIQLRTRNRAENQKCKR